MAQPSLHRFPLPLDPTAQEFRPTYIYYSFSPPPPFMLSSPSTVLPPPSILPTRALLLTSVPTNVSESTVRRELEVFGDVRAVQMERLRHGILTVHFYDLRQATEALNKIQEHYLPQLPRFDGVPPRGLLCGRVIGAQFVFPLAAELPDRFNQGTVTISLNSNVSTGVIRDIFEAFGAVKEIRGTPLNSNQRFVEFYDTRDAAKAVAAVNGQEINGKPAVVEFNRPYKPNLCVPDSVHKVHPPLVPPYGRQLPVRKDGLVEYGVVREVIGKNSNLVKCGGLKKNVKNVFKHRQSPEQWVGFEGGNDGRNKPWKEPRYNSDPRFLIKCDAFISRFHDSRTTVMIKNIPNKYSQKLLLNMLDNHCIQCNVGDDQPLSSYDFVYLPIDFVNKCNVGYGFVNMTSPEGTWSLYKAFNHRSWEVFNSKKICEVSYARLQGLEALKEHFKTSKFPCETEEYMPVVFTPPRDGRTVTEPMPIVGRSTTITSSSVGCDDATSASHNNLLVEDAQSPSLVEEPHQSAAGMSI